MKIVLAALLSAVVLGGIVAPANAADCRKNSRGDVVCYVYVTSRLAERQSRKETFDPTLYYERDSNAIPFGTAAWWRQKEFEAGRR
ncbi:MAG: hypothetical protein F9K29_23240 [Hyphomicrobiaceae bacterium]|nr:MAG: hypothetical protein F9K29_23240 [Hyphomicrobiaceae bacterium]